LMSKKIVPIGIGFRERSSAFDLNASIQDRIHLIQKLNGIEKNLEEIAISDARETQEAEARLLTHGHVDLSLKPGERIKVKRVAVKDDDDSDSEHHDGADGYSTSKHIRGPSIPVVAVGGSMLLAPPPTVDESIAETTKAEKEKVKKKTGKRKENNNQSTEGTDPNNTNSIPSSVPAKATTTTTVPLGLPAEADDEWGDFSSA